MTRFKSCPSVPRTPTRCTKQDRRRRLSGDFARQRRYRVNMIRNRRCCIRFKDFSSANCYLRDRARGMATKHAAGRAIFRDSESLRYRTSRHNGAGDAKQTLLSVAFDNLTLGRVTLNRSILGNAPLDAHNPASKPRYSFTAAGRCNHLPRALLVRSWLRAFQGDFVASRADLDEAQQIAERGPMRLHLADIHLHRARLFRDRKELQKARALIERCGYHRRDEELRDAEQALGL